MRPVHSPTFSEWLEATKTPDPKEAPEGYAPVTKASLKDGEGNCDNFCNHCDWRRDCSKAICSCAAHDRKDGMSVVFKKIETQS